MAAPGLLQTWSSRPQAGPAPKSENILGPCKREPAAGTASAPEPSGAEPAEGHGRSAGRRVPTPAARARVRRVRLLRVFHLNKELGSGQFDTMFPCAPENQALRRGVWE